MFVLSKLKKLFKGKSKKSEQKLNESEFNGIRQFAGEIIKPGINIYLKMIKELEKPGFVKFGNDSTFSKCFRCLCMYDSAINYVIKARVKGYSEVKMHLQPPTDLACDVIQISSKKSKFQESSEQIGIILAQEPTRIGLSFHAFFDRFKNFFKEFLKKSGAEDEAVKYFNDNVPRLMRQARLALREDWDRRECELKFENLPRFKNFWEGPDSVDGSMLREKIIQITAANNELAVLLGRIDAMVNEIDKAISGNILNGVEGFKKLSQKLDAPAKK